MQNYADVQLAVDGQNLLRGCVWVGFYTLSLTYCCQRDRLEVCVSLGH